MSGSSTVSSVETTFAVASMDVAAPSFTKDNSLLDPKFTAATPIVIPESALGSVFTVHATAVDGNDRHSNVIDLAIDLK